MFRRRTTPDRMGCKGPSCSSPTVSPASSATVQPTAQVATTATAAAAMPALAPPTSSPAPTPTPGQVGLVDRPIRGRASPAPPYYCDEAADSDGLSELMAFGVRPVSTPVDVPRAAFAREGSTGEGSLVDSGRRLEQEMFEVFAASPTLSPPIRRMRPRSARGPPPGFAAGDHRAALPAPASLMPSPNSFNAIRRARSSFKKGCMSPGRPQRHDPTVANTRGATPVGKGVVKSRFSLRRDRSESGATCSLESMMSSRESLCSTDTVDMQRPQPDRCLSRKPSGSDLGYNSRPSSASSCGSFGQPSRYVASVLAGQGAPLSSLSQQFK